MENSKWFHTGIGCIAGALITGLAVSSARAQTETAQPAGRETTDAPSTSGGLEEIVVTAQRREESVQDIPVAISAFGGEQIEKLGVASIENIAPRVPSFYFGSFGALRPQLYIRGIGTRSFDPGSESSVGVFADEVYLGRSSGSFGSLKDIERVEVLRGPQGTLYGRNTIGGAINIISKGPTPQFKAEAEAGFSNFGGYEALSAAGGPLNESKSLQFRAAAWRSYRDGYVTDVNSGKQFQGLDNTGGRLRFAYLPTDALRIDLTAELLHDGDEAGFGGYSQGTGPSATGAPANPAAVFFAASGRVPTLTSDPRHVYLNVAPSLDRDAASYIARVEFAGEAATLTSISAYHTLKVADSRDLDGSSLSTIDQYSDESSDQFTQELRLTSAADGPLSLGGKLDWILGGFYYHDESDRTDRFEVGVDSVVRAPRGTSAVDIGLSDYRITSYALFGQATAHISEHIDLTLGGRYTRDRKHATQAGTTTDTLPIIAAPFEVNNEATYSSFDPRIVATYKFSPDINIYASYSTGFKSGGFQYVPFSLGQANVLFDPEEIEAWEAGFKSTLLDGRLRVNAAAFYYDYSNLQVSRITDAGGAPATLISNAASSEIKGIDLEVQGVVGPNLELSLAYGYLDATYQDYIFNLGANLDFSNTEMVRAPHHSVNVGAEWHAAVGNGEMSLRADYAVVSRFFFEPGEGNNKFGSGVPLSTEDGYGLLDVRAAYEWDHWRVTAYVTNALDEDYRRTVNALGSTVVGFPGQPRVYGLKVGWQF